MLSLCVLLAAELLSASPADSEECPWRAGKEPPSLTQERGGFRFQARYDPLWFRCAKQAGGTLVLRIFTGREGKLKLLRTRPVRSYSLHEGVGPGDLCEQDPPENQVQVTLTGKGVMERLTYRSEVLETYCARCPWRGADNMLVLRMGRGRARRGKATLVSRVDKKWHRCAKPGSTLQMLFFTGESWEEVREAREPVFVIRGLERSHRFRKKVPLRRLCKGAPSYVGYEYRGTGEMQTMNGRGRSIQQLRCR